MQLAQNKKSNSSAECIPKKKKKKRKKEKKRPTEIFTVRSVNGNCHRLLYALMPEDCKCLSTLNNPSKVNNKQQSIEFTEKSIAFE